MDRLAAPAQQNGIAAAQAQRGGIGSHIGTAFINDPDQADGHPYARQLEPCRSSGAIYYLANRIIQPRDCLYRSSNALEPFGSQRQPVEHRIAQTGGPPGLQIARIGSKDRRLVAAQRLCRAAQCIGTRVACHGGKLALRGAAA